MTQTQTIEKNRAEAKQKNEDLKRQAADRLAKNAAWNKQNKPKKSKGI